MFLADSVIYIHKNENSNIQSIKVIKQRYQQDLPIYSYNEENVSLSISQKINEYDKDIQVKFLNDHDIVPFFEQFKNKYDFSIFETNETSQKNQFLNTNINISNYEFEPNELIAKVTTISNSSILYQSIPYQSIYFFNSSNTLYCLLFSIRFNTVFIINIPNKDLSIFHDFLNLDFLNNLNLIILNKKLTETLSTDKLTKQQIKI